MIAKEDVLSKLDIRAEYEALGVRTNGQMASADGWLPVHALGREDRTPSASINLKTGHYTDHGGEGESLTFWDAAIKYGGHADFKAALNHYAAKVGVSTNRQPTKKSKVFATTKGIVAYFVEALTKQHGTGVRLAGTWTYDTFHVLRFDLPTPAGEKQRKEFRPVHQVPLGLDGGLGWRAGYPAGPRPLYCRKALEGEPSDLVTVHGGEKAADAAMALGLVATTNAGGEKAMDHTDWSPVLRFATGTIVVDNDSAGEAFGQIMAAKIRRLKPGADVRIVKLPGLPQKGDIVEWIAAGGTREEFARLVDASPLVTAAQAAEWDKRIRKASSPKSEGITNAIAMDEKTVVPIPMDEIIETIGKISGDWPRRVQNALFVHDQEEGICWLERPPALFGWVARKHGIVDWRRSNGCVTKEELFAEMQRTATKYEAVDEVPHEPPVPGHYYTCGEIPAGDGTALQRFLNFHKHASPIDRQLHLAVLVTPGWGGPPGTRPAGMFTAMEGRGKGKSKALQHVGAIYDGMVDVSPAEEIEDIKKRLLNAEGRSKRIVSLDNVKSTRFSWAELEALITADTISGWKNYLGESTRPNFLTWLITLNGASLSTDLAQRVVEVQLGEPTYSGDWDSDVAQFLRVNRLKLLADIIGFLRLPAKRMKQHSRWGAWEAGVLSRVDNPDECLAAILERRGRADVEQEESEILEDAFSGRLRGLGYDIERDDVFIPVDIATQWYNHAMNERKRTTSVTRLLKQMRTKEGFTSWFTTARDTPDIGGFGGPVSMLIQPRKRKWTSGTVWQIRPRKDSEDTKKLETADYGENRELEF